MTPAKSLMTPEQAPTQAYTPPEQKRRLQLGLKPWKGLRWILERQTRQVSTGNKRVQHIHRRNITVVLTFRDAVCLETPGVSWSLPGGLTSSGEDTRKSTIELLINGDLLLNWAAGSLPQSLSVYFSKATYNLTFCRLAASLCSATHIQVLVELFRGKVENVTVSQ